MPGQTGKGSRKRRQAALERKATPHHDFVGDAEPEREEARSRKAERLDKERNHDAVREMAAKLEQAAGLLFVPVRLGLSLAGEVLRLPFAVLRVLRREEA